MKRIIGNASRKTIKDKLNRILKERGGKNKSHATKHIFALL